MASKTIPELDAATTIGLNDSIVVQQNGVTKRCSTSVFLSNAPAALVNKEPATTPESGPISLTSECVVLTVPSGATLPVAYSVGASSHGATKTIVANISAAQPANLTFTNGAGFTTVSFVSNGSSITIRNINGSWYITSKVGDVNVY